MSSLKYYAVTGRGFFPTDMLRYDSASAMNETEQEKINARTYDDSEPHHEQWEKCRDLTTICLMSDQRGAPCIERWASFGWIVTEVLFNEDGYRGMAPGEQYLINKGEGSRSC